MQTHTKLIIGTIIMCLSFSGFSQKCTKFIDYQNKTINTKGLTAVVGGQSFNVGATDVTPLYRETSERLQMLDLAQYALCEKVKNLPKFLREKVEMQHTNMLLDILKEAMQSNGTPMKLDEVIVPSFTETAEAEKETIVPPVDPPKKEAKDTPTTIVAETCDGYSSDKEYIRALGYGESMNRGMAKDYAQSYALEALALSTEISVKVACEHYRLSEKKGLTEDFEERLEKNTQTAINQTLRGVENICEKYVKNAETNIWECYLVLEISRENILKSTFNNLQKDPMVKETLPNYERFKNTFNKVMKELDKSEEINFDF